MTKLGFLVLLSAASYAEQSFDGPVAGYVAVSARPEVRAILGVPGSFRFSDPLRLPDGVTRVQMAPGQDFAWMERSGAPPAILVLRGGAVDAVMPVEGAIAAPDLVVFSPGGAAALTFSAAAARISVITGLPAGPRAAFDIDTSLLPKPPCAAAVNDDGSVVLAATSEAVFALAPDRAPRLVLSGARIQGLALVHGGADAVVADRGAGTVSLIHNVASAPEVRTLASGLTDLAAMAVARDENLLYVFRAAAGAVSWVDLASGEVQSAALPAHPAGLLPLRNRDMFLISARRNEPAWIFYRDGAQPRTVFVPAIRTALERGR